MSVETKYIYLKSHPLFSEMNDEKLKELSAIVKIYTLYRGGAASYGEGDYSKIYFVVKGKIKIAEANDMGEELIKDILTLGDIFGDISLYGSWPVNEYAEALTDNTMVCSFNVSDFRKILKEDPMLALSYAGSVNSKLQKAEARYSDLVFRDAKSRLILFIKYWASMDGKMVGDKIVLNNYLTHSDIAGFISTSRQSVNILLNELRDSGVLFYNRQKIELSDSFTLN